ALEIVEKLPEALVLPLERDANHQAAEARALDARRIDVGLAIDDPDARLLRQFRQRRVGETPRRREVGRQHLAVEGLQLLVGARRAGDERAGRRVVAL